MLIRKEKNKPSWEETHEQGPRGGRKAVGDLVKRISGCEEGMEVCSKSVETKAPRWSGGENKGDAVGW